MSSPEIIDVLSQKREREIAELEARRIAKVAMMNTVAGPEGYISPEESQRINVQYVNDPGNPIEVRVDNN